MTVWCAGAYAPAKHVENRNKHTQKNVRQVCYVQGSCQNARSTKHKKANSCACSSLDVFLDCTETCNLLSHRSLINLEVCATYRHTTRMFSHVEECQLCPGT